MSWNSSGLSCTLAIRSGDYYMFDYESEEEEEEGKQDEATTAQEQVRDQAKIANDYNGCVLDPASSHSKGQRYRC